MCRLLSDGESDFEDINLSDEEGSSDSIEEFDDDEFSAFSDLCPAWLSQTAFNYREFYLNQLIPRFRQNIVRPCIMGSSIMSVIFSFQDVAECALLFDYIFGYFQGYNIYPEIRYLDSDTVNSVHVRWLGGCLADCVLNSDGNTTNDVVCLLNTEFC